jgi:steroid delta-isomerase-like uncharacterized protein
MNEILGLCIVCGFLGAVVSSGRQETNANPPAKPRQTEKNASEETVTVETLQQILEAFNRHDLDAIMAYFSDDCSFDFPRGPEPFGQRFTGKSQVREALAGRFKGVPDVHYGDDRHWVAGEMGVSEWTLTGTTTSGVSLKVRGCDHWEFRNGKVVRKDSYWKIVER